MTSMRRNDVASTSFRRHVSTRVLINQYQIIAFLILKSYIIQNSRIELRGIVLPVPSNQSYIYYYFTLQLGTFVIFSWVGGWGGRYVAPPLSNYWGGNIPAPPPLPPPSSYAYGVLKAPFYNDKQSGKVLSLVNLYGSSKGIYAMAFQICGRNTDFSACAVDLVNQLLYMQKMSVDSSISSVDSHKNNIMYCCWFCLR